MKIRSVLLQTSDGYPKTKLRPQRHYLLPIQNRNFLHSWPQRTRLGHQRKIQESRNHASDAFIPRKPNWRPMERNPTWDSRRESEKLPSFSVPRLSYHRCKRHNFFVPPFAPPLSSSFLAIPAIVGVGEWWWGAPTLSIALPNAKGILNEIKPLRHIPVKITLWDPRTSTSPSI